MAEKMVAHLKLDKTYIMQGYKVQVQAKARVIGFYYCSGYWSPSDFEIDSIDLTSINVFYRGKEIYDFPEELKEEVHNDFFKMAEEADFDFDMTEEEIAAEDAYIEYLEEEALARQNAEKEQTLHLEEMVKNSKLLKAIYG